MAQTVYHVVPSGGEWAVKKQGAEQPSRMAATQKEAINHAEIFARRQTPSRIVIHREDGAISEQRSFDLTVRPESPWTEILTMPPVLTGLALALGVGGLVWLLRRD